jgi:magnesium transporter
MPEKNKLRSKGADAVRDIRMVRRIAQKITIYPGAVPGTLRPVPGSSPAVVRYLAIRPGAQYRQETVTDLAQLPTAAASGMNWVRVIGLGAVEPLQTITEAYGIRKLALEDILSPGWRTKMERYGDYSLFVLQAPPDVSAGQKRGEHLTLFSKPGLIITFEECATTLVDFLWERLQQEAVSVEMVRPAEFLTYMVLDLIVDRFYPHLDLKDEELASLEDRLNTHAPRRVELTSLHRIKRDLITLRRLLIPFKELRAEMARDGAPGAVQELRPFFNDLGDHILQASDLVETYNDVARSLDEIVQASLTNRMNDVVRMLTIISTIFMPLSFIAGVYGMNFNPEASPWNMPELAWRYGYLMALGIMGAIVGSMLWYFRKRGWFD